MTKPMKQAMTASWIASSQNPTRVVTSMPNRLSATLPAMRTTTTSTAGIDRMCDRATAASTVSSAGMSR